MTRRPTKETTAGQRYLALQRKARRTGRPTDELIQLYALEGLLDRLTKSQYTENFVLKGGVLLAALDARRPTRDIDFAAHRLANDGIQCRLARDANLHEPAFSAPSRRVGHGIKSVSQ